MQYSIVTLSKAKQRYDFRIDSEFFHPKFLDLDKKIKKKQTVILEIIKEKVSDGTHFTPTYLDNGVPFLSALNIQENHFYFEDNYQFISPKEHISLYKRCDPKAGDILLRKVGVGLRWACVVPENIPEFSIFVSVAQIRCKKDTVDPFYLSIFINCSYGQQQLLRFNKGISQPDLHLEDIRLLEIPTFSDTFQRIIKCIYLSSQKKVALAKKTYKEAEFLILSELGMLGWEPKHALSFVRKYSEIEQVERIDAEYFQPKYDEIENAIKSYKGGYSLIKDEFKQNKSTFNVDSNETYQYIEIGSINVSSGEIVANEVLGDELPANAKRVLKKNDVVISKVRTYRGAITIIDQDGYIGSGAFTVLHENGRINKETLLAFLHSKPLLAWSLKPNTGTSYPVIVDDDILNLPIPLISDKIQAQIQQKISESLNLRKQSKHLLEVAKKGVEMAIEKDENTAMKWISEQTAKA